MRLLGDRLLLAPLPAQEKSDGGIILPGARVGDVMYFFRVEAVGSGKRGKDGQVRPLEIAVGDIVVTPLYTDHTQLEDGTNRRIVGVDQIIGKLVDEVFQPTVVPDPIAEPAPAS